MSDTVTHLDFETRSAVDLNKAGAYRYAMDPSTEVLCLSYRVGDGPIQRWSPGDPPLQVARMLAHNAAFERAIWNHTLGWPTLSPEMQDCTLARGVAVGLPASLEMLGQVLGAPVQKDKDGHRLMLKLCKPRKVHDDGRIEWWSDVSDLDRLAAYCDQDVRSECAVDERLPRLSGRERAVWELDQQINDRGFALDVSRVQAALSAVTEAKRRADRRMWRITEGKVGTCSQTGKLVGWIVGRGIPCASVAKGEIDEIVLLADLFDDPLVEDVIRLRRSAARSSTAKYKAMLDCVCPDGRVRGTLAYHGAHPGRWAGRLVQPQNFPRVDDPDAVEAALALLHRADAVDAIEAVVGPPMEVLSKCLRSMIVAPAGKKLIGGDFSNIEGRVNAWFAGEHWKLDAFRAYDAGEGPDLYRVMAGEILDKTPTDISKVERQTTGKVPELACGYQGGLKAFQKMAYTQDPPVRVTDAEARSIVRLWRDRNPGIVASWSELQDAAIQAVEARGCIVPVLGDKVRYVADAKFLYCKLPSGRVIHYPSPSVSWKEKVVTIDDEEIVLRNRGVTFYGVDSVTKRWGPQDLYGGMQCNHIVQGTARDLMVEAMFAVEKAGYPIVLTVHDELLCEVDEDFGSVEEFESLMGELPVWAEGLPLVAQAWSDKRYVK